MPLNIDLHEIDIGNDMILAELIDAYCLHALGAGIPEVSQNEIYPFIRPQFSAKTL